jgi:hypothetical protein
MRESGRRDSVRRIHLWHPVHDIEAFRRRKVSRAGCAAAQDDNCGEIFRTRALPGFVG